MPVARSRTSVSVARWGRKAFSMVSPSPYPSPRERGEGSPGRSHPTGSRSVASLRGEGSSERRQLLSSRGLRDVGEDLSNVDVDRALDHAAAATDAERRALAHRVVEELVHVALTHALHLRGPRVVAASDRKAR